MTANFCAYACGPSNLLMVDAVLDSIHKIKVCVDTGASFSIMPKQLADKLSIIFKPTNKSVTLANNTKYIKQRRT